MPYRAAKMDTQDGIVVRSRKLAAQALRVFENATSPDYAYQVRLTDKGEWIRQSRENGILVT